MAPRAVARSLPRVSESSASGSGTSSPSRVVAPPPRNDPGRPEAPGPNDWDTAVSLVDGIISLMGDLGDQVEAATDSSTGARPRLAVASVLSAVNELRQFAAVRATDPSPRASRERKEPPTPASGLPRDAPLVSPTGRPLPPGWQPPAYASSARLGPLVGPGRVELHAGLPAEDADTLGLLADTWSTNRTTALVRALRTVSELVTATTGDRGRLVLETRDGRRREMLMR